MKSNQVINLIRAFSQEFSNDNDLKLSSSKRYYQLLVNDLPNELQLLFNSKYLIKGSVGKGQKTKYPWICIFNPKITTTAQKGLYVVILFKSDLSGFYLTLGQGITNFANKFKSKKYVYASKVATYFRDEIQSTTFSLDEIDLLSQKGDLGYGYEQSSIVSKYYLIDILEEYDLISDIREILSIYDEIYEDMKPYNYDEVIDRIINDETIEFLPLDEAEIIITEALSKTVEQNFFSTTTIEEVTVPTAPKRTFTKIKKSSVKKIDYIKKAVNDSEIGLKGERLVMIYEKQRLESIGLGDFVNKIKWESRESDLEGFDILSYDIIDGTIEKIYIEVKTTTKGINENFYLTRNELEESKKRGQTYYIYRLFDVNADPKLYKIKGNLEEKLILNVSTYLASPK